MKDSETGKTNTLYTVWAGIKNRTAEYRTHHEKYTRYAGRGIHMHEPWRQSYEEFEAYILSELGERPSDKHSLDRIDNDGGYVPGNLRWATHTQQNRNTTKSKEKHLRRSLLDSLYGADRATLREFRQLTGVR